MFIPTFKTGHPILQKASIWAQTCSTSGRFSDPDWWSDQWWWTFWNILQPAPRISGAQPQWLRSLSCVWSRSFSSDCSVRPDTQLWKESWLFQSFSFRMMKARNLLSGTCSRTISVAFSRWLSQTSVWWPSGKVTRAKFKFNKRALSTNVDAPKCKFELDLH